MQKLGLSLLALAATPPVCLGQGTFGPISVAAGIGVEAAHIRDNTTWIPGFTLHAALTLQPQRSRLGLRLAGWFFDRQRQEPNFSTRGQAAGLGLEGRYDLVTGRTRLYGFAGAGSGWFYTALSGAGELRNSGSAFLSGGLGAERQVSRASLFVELRAVRPLLTEGFGNNLAPLAFGLRI
jgi:hypothetical protein